jgi:hypothetical protein
MPNTSIHDLQKKKRKKGQYPEKHRFHPKDPTRIFILNSHKEMGQELYLENLVILIARGLSP